MKKLVTTLSIALFALIACSPETGAQTGQTVILVSFDGFRHDYMDRGISPNLTTLAGAGLRAKSMRPVFPSKTFPNHYSIATGLYPSNHGIVSNTMYDKDANAWFRISDTVAVRSSLWWHGEPIWSTAVKQGQRSACFFWVGSEAEVAGVHPTYWKKYDGSVPHEVRVRTALEWLDLPEAARPSLITLYFDDTDGAGHRYGPEAPETNDAIARVDSALGLLIDGLRERDLFDTVNLIVLSDHGMTQLDPERVIYWDDVQDPSTVTVIDQGPLLALNAPAESLSVISERLGRLGPHVTVLSDEVLRERFQMNRTPRVPDVIALADEGWMVLQRRTMRRPVSGGTHGYDNEAPDMQAFFVAHGPAFRRGAAVERVHAVDVYALVAHMLGLEPAPNDGSFDRIREVLK